MVLTRMALPYVAFYFLFCIIADVSAQSTDIFRAQYTLVPENEDGLQTVRYRFLLNVPIKLKEKKFLVLGAEYNRIELNSSATLPFDAETIDNFQIIDFNIGYIVGWKNDWTIVSVLTPRLATNFSGDLSTEDIFINATVAAIQVKSEGDKPYQLALGLSFNSAAGRPVPLPVIRYTRRFHPEWSYSVGVPRSEIIHHFDTHNTLRFSVLLDGYLANIREDFVLPSGDGASRQSATTLVTGLEYRYNFTKMVSLFALVGVTPTSNSILRDDNNDQVFKLSDGVNAYIRSGVRVSIF